MNNKDKEYSYLRKQKSIDLNSFKNNDISYLFKNKQISYKKNAIISRSFSLNDLRKAQERYYISEAVKNMSYYESLIWSNEMEKSIENQQNLCLKLLKKDCLEKLSKCENLITQVSNILEKLKIIDNDLKNAYENSYDFRANYERLIKEKQIATLLEDQITQNLEIYDSLDEIFKLLCTSGTKLVTKPEFFDILKKLDRGLLMMKEHPNYKDSEMYNMKFSQCLAKALSLISIFFIHSIKELNEKIHKNAYCKESNNLFPLTLLYRKFHVSALQLKPYIKEIEMRVKDYNEYKLINPIVLEKVNELSKNEDILVFTRLSITFFFSLCYDEFSLFHNFFENEDPKFYYFSQKLLKPISIYLQSGLSKHSDLSLFCEILSIIKTKLLQNTKNETLSNINLNHYKLDFTILFNEIIKNVQSHIIFETQNIAKLEIQNFVPDKNDLNFAKKFKDESNSLLEGIFETQEKGIFGGDSTTQWYPTLNKAILLLSKIYPLLNSELFNSVSYDIIDLSISSFIHASQMQKDISIRDSQLFLIKHLLILRDRLLEFNIDFFHFESKVNINTSNTNSWDVYNKIRLFNPLKLYKSALNKIYGPSTNEKATFSKFNSILQNAINISIEHSLKPLMEPIQEIQNIKNPSNDLIKAKINECLIILQKEAPIIKSTFLSYIENSQITHIFFTDIIKKFSKRLDDIKKHLPTHSLTIWSQTCQLVSYLNDFLLSNQKIKESHKNIEQMDLLPLDLS
ncbi:hypothetical protein PCANB_002796 [Pneumocystis canis]|nr:hypothetical protein PCANB_002796 [Pneumocystis canis]